MLSIVSLAKEIVEEDKQRIIRANEKMCIRDSFNALIAVTFCVVYHHPAKIGYAIGRIAEMCIRDRPR